MAKKKTTNKEVVVETTQVIEPIQVKAVESIVEPQVSMEDFTMIEKYQQDKNQSIAIRPFVTDGENIS